MVACCKTVVDGPRGGWGLAYILAGTARLVGELLVGRGFSTWVPAGVEHDLKPVTKAVLLECFFPRGPLQSIPYTWLPSRL